MLNSISKRDFVRSPIIAGAVAGVGSLPLIALLLVLSVPREGAAAAQSSRDDWKRVHSALDLQALLTHSLADAPLTSAERAQIYKVIDDKTIHDSFTDDQRDEERKTVLSARVGRIGLADDGSQQILVEGPSMFCGATGNCSLWVFNRHDGKLQLVLAAGGGLFFVRQTSRHGYHDVATGWHMSAFEEAYAVYGWNGTKYEQIDCYGVAFDRNSSGGPPAVTDCPKTSQ